MTPVLEEDSGATVSPHEGMSPLASSPSDEDRSRVSLPTPTLPPVFFEMDKVLEKPSKKFGLRRVLKKCILSETAPFNFDSILH